MTFYLSVTKIVLTTTNIVAQMMKRPYWASIRKKIEWFCIQLFLYGTQEAEGSQPTMKTRRNEDTSKMYKIKDINVCVNVMYDMCACYYCVL